MDFSKFKNNEDNRVSNTFEGDKNLNPYAGSLDNYFDNEPQSTDDNGSIGSESTAAKYNTSNYGNSYGRNYDSTPYENGLNYERRAPTASKGTVQAIIAITFILLFGYIGFGTYYHISKTKSEYSTNTPIARGVDPAEAVEQTKVERIRTREEFKAKLEKMIQDGVDDLYVDATKDLTEDDVEAVCKSLDLDPFLYKYSGYYYTTSTQKEGDGPEYDTGEVGVNVQIDPTLEGLVYLNLTEGREIPADDIKASKLKVSCETFLKENITDDMSDYEKELVIHDYLVNKCNYASNISGDKDVYSAYGVMLNRKAVCEGYSRATALLLKLCNIETTLITGKIEDEETGEVEDDNHMWNLVKIDGKWYHLDTTWDDPIGENELNHMYMNLDDEIAGKNHDWDRSKYESCTSMDANYYTVQGTYFKDDDSFQTYVRQQLEDGNRTTIECVVGDVDLSEETLGFIFEYEGVGSYYLSWGNIEGFKHLVIHINGN